MNSEQIKMVRRLMNAVATELDLSRPRRVSLADLTAENEKTHAARHDNARAELIAAAADVATMLRLVDAD